MTTSDVRSSGGQSVINPAAQNVLHAEGQSARIQQLVLALRQLVDDLHDEGERRG